MEELERSQQRVQQATERTSNTARELGLTFSSAFEDAIIKGESFSKVLQGILQDIARIVVRRTITEVVASGSADVEVVNGPCRCSSASMSTAAVTMSATESNAPTSWNATSSTLSTRLPPASLRSSEMCSRPSLPGVSETKAPKVVVLTTVPR